VDRNATGGVDASRCTNERCMSFKETDVGRHVKDGHLGVQNIAIGP
jgi:hypothetical protein